MKKYHLGLIIMFLLAAKLVVASESELMNEIQKLKTKNEFQSVQIQQIQDQTKLLLEQKNKPLREVESTWVGGYGEINYNKYNKASSRDQIDLSRFVISLGHRFDEKLSFDGELELEHAIASKSDSGEIEIEQAFLTYQFSPNLHLKAGLFLMPFGFLNKSHEPPVFYGVERNIVETRIIPSTWREGGIGVFGSTNTGFDWSLGIVTGFDIAKFDDPESPLGAIHQELQLAKAHDLSLYGTINYRIPGFVLGTGIFFGKATQGNANFEANGTNPNFTGINGLVTLADVHTQWRQDSWDFQALYAKGLIGDSSAVNDAISAYNIANPADSRSFVPTEFYGWLLQAAYKFQVGANTTLSPFVRYEEFDTQAKMSNNLTADPANSDKATTLGFSLHPHQQVVFKADYQSYAKTSNNNRTNIGLGYMF